MSRKKPRGLDPLRIGLLMSEEESNRLIKERVAEEYRRMVALADSMGIHDAPNNWYSVALALAKKYVPELRENKLNHAPTKWGMFELMMLGGEIERLVNRHSMTIENAANELATREPWKSFVGKKQGTYFGPDPGVALRKQYKKREALLGWDVYQSCEATNRLDEWEQLLESISGNK